MEPACCPAPCFLKPALLQRICLSVQEQQGIPCDWATETLVTVGATEAIAAAMLGLLNPGDEVGGWSRDGMCGDLLARSPARFAHTCAWGLGPPHVGRYSRLEAG